LNISFKIPSYSTTCEVAKGESHSERCILSQYNTSSAVTLSALTMSSLFFSCLFAFFACSCERKICLRKLGENREVMKMQCKKAKIRKNGSRGGKEKISTEDKKYIHTYP